ncbi:uncharacterized protein FA14DRAFT_45036 [Meira miltonrushii]|uniref:Uncharacterized protein n=1 Tax=Meira miltonrushii TaxID=1280837 RepID=A0A316VD90_9BASI|nr:uncharacterized protein FA14DRAFT_45036 [Meira miltonrushii]PWN35647.1 hypothetical protein FA14DRAFT_45036 [Meira miltonrushii]
MLPVSRAVLMARRPLSLRSSPLIMQGIRFESTNTPSTPPTPVSPARETAHSSPSAGPSQQQQQQEKPKSKHKLVYREIWPPFIRVLAYASAVYFSLQLTWQYLDGREQKELEADVRRQLEEEVRKEMIKKAERAKSDQDAIAQKAKGWFSWATGK